MKKTKNKKPLLSAKEARATVEILTRAVERYRRKCIFMTASRDSVQDELKTAREVFLTIVTNKNKEHNSLILTHHSTTKALERYECETTLDTFKRAFWKLGAQVSASVNKVLIKLKLRK